MTMQFFYPGPNAFDNIPGLGGGAAVAWDALPAGTEGDRSAATLESLAITAERGELYWHPAYPTKAQLASLWPSADQEDGVCVGPMSEFWLGVAEENALVVWLGDSTNVGQGGTGGNVGCRAVSPPVLVAASKGWRDGCAAANGLVVADNRVTERGWTFAVKEIAGSCWVHNTTPEDLDFAPGIAFDSLIVTGVAVFGNDATVTVLVDGSSVGTIDCNTLTNGGIDHPQVRVNVTRGVHTVTIRSGGGGGTCYCNTIETYDSLSTVPDLLMLAVADSNIGDHIADGAYRTRQRLRLLRTNHKTKRITAAFMGTINDLDDSTAVATITAGFTTLAGFVNEIGGKFLGICGWATNRAGVTKANLDTLSAHLKTLSQSNGTAWIDTRAALGYTYAATDPADVSDDWHLTAAGQAKQAGIIAKAFG